MPFKKGDLNINRSGRPKQPEELKESANNILNVSLASIKSKIKDLSPTQHIKLISVLMPYLLPRLQAVEMVESDMFSSLSDEDIEQLVNRILDEYNGRTKRKKT